MEARPHCGLKEEATPGLGWRRGVAAGGEGSARLGGAHRPGGRREPVQGREPWGRGRGPRKGRGAHGGGRSEDPGPTGGGDTRAPRRLGPRGAGGGRGPGRLPPRGPSLRRGRAPPPPGPPLCCQRVPSPPREDVRLGGTPCLDATFLTSGSPPSPIPAFQALGCTRHRDRGGPEGWEVGCPARAGLGVRGRG